MALYTIRSQRELANMANAPKYNPNSEVMWNALGRDAGSQTSNDNFFTKRAKSIDNAVGTTGAALAASAKDAWENLSTQTMRQDNKAKMNDIAKKYGYNTYQDVWDARDRAEASGDKATLDLIDNTINPQLRAQANTNAQAANEKAEKYKDYMQNNDVSKRINQDRGKFAGSAMNTLSTGFDVLSMAAGIPNGPVINGIQGAWEGVADELEQNGEQNFDWGRAGKNAAVGAASGLATGALNKGVNNIIAKRGGNLFKGGNALTAGLNKWNATNPVGKVLSTVGTGVARGAQSGLVGGAVGAGTSSALNGVDIGQGIANTVQGAVEGAKSGAVTGGIMAGTNLAANAALNKVAPNVMNKVQANQARNAAYGDTLRDQFKGAWNSGDSGAAEFFKSVPGKVGAAVDNLRQTPIANIGNATRDVSGGAEAQDNQGNLIRLYRGLEQEYDPNYPASRLDTNGYESWTDNPELARQYGDNVYYIDVPENDIRTSYLDENPSSPTYGDRNPIYRTDKKAGINGVSGNEYQLEVGSDYQKGLTYSPLEETMTQRPTTRTTQATSGWDNIAQEAGYRNYDEVIQRFVEANPNAEVNAGAVLTWMDNNPGDWNPNMRQTVTATEQEQPQTKTSRQIRGERKIVEEITSQFNAPDKPTVRATKPQETFKNLYNEWGLSDGDEIRQAVSYAEPGSLIPKMISEAAGEAGIIDLSDAQSMVLDLGLNKSSNYKKTVSVLSDIWDSMPNEDIVGGKSGVNALKFQRAIEQAASDAQGTSGEYHVGNNLVDQTTAKNLMRIANNIGDKLDEAATAKGTVQNVLNRYAGDIQEMRNAFPNNTKWQNMVDAEIAGAKTIRDLRHSIKDLTRANIYINNGDENFSTVGGRWAARNSNVPTSKAGVINRAVNWAVDKVEDTPLARNMRLKSYTKAAEGGAPTPATTGTTTTTTPDTTFNPATQIYNAIGRDTGERQGEEQRIAQYLNKAVNDQTIAGNTLEGLVAPLGATTSTAGTGSTSVYDSVYGSSTPTTSFMSEEEERAKYFYPPTGDYWTDMLSQAMRNAKNAEDYSALGSLYEMYMDAVAKNEKSSTSEAKLTDKQRQANAAARALDDFEQEESNFAYDVSDIPIIGGLANMGGNTYGSKAEALALQVGYMLSGATVNKEEAKNIGMAYVPQPRDTAAVRQSKLNQLRGIISDYQKTYAE